MHKVKTQIFLTLIFLIALGAIQARSQEIKPNPENDSAEIFRTIPSAVETDDCAAMLDKTLDAYEKLLKAKSDVDAELSTTKDLREKERIYNQELLKAVALLTSSEKRDKSFFKKLLNQFGKTLKAATTPEALTTIAGMIVIIRKL